MVVWFESLLYCFYAVLLAYHIKILLLNPFRPEVHVSNIYRFKSYHALLHLR